MVNPPIYCRAAAYELFAAQLPSLDDTESLVLAATAVSMHALDDVQSADVLARLDALAARVERRLQSGQPQAIHAHLHQVLFDEEGFRGNTHDYYSPLNSYLPAVLQSKKGIPISLALIYKAVAERLGLPVEGVNAPGHFLVRVRAGRDEMIVDPFRCGQVLSTAEAASRVAQVSGVASSFSTLLPAASHRQWLGRILRNLRCIFANAGCRNDLAAVDELCELFHHEHR